ncbi:MAG: 30S ribosomal protein S6 [Parcubacteria group bacterium]|jgi:ribosomal protein S6
MEYEICYLIGESKEANLDKIRPIVEQIIEKHKGTFTEGEFVRKRRLSYIIKGESRGTYVARRFTVPTRDEREEMSLDYDIMGEMNKELRFNQDILRFMLVKTDNLPPLKDLEIADEKNKGQFSMTAGTRREEKKVEAPKKEVIPVEKVVTEAKEEKKEETKTEVVKVKENKEEVAKETKKEITEKPKKKAKKKEEDEILGDDIDEKLDEILNI